MSQYELFQKREEADIGINKRKEQKEEYIENKAFIEFLIQHEPRKGIDFSKIKIQLYLNMDVGED